MTPERYKELDTKGCGLTSEEKAEGWHFCDDWDEMLIGPGYEELASCSHRKLLKLEAPEEVSGWLGSCDEFAKWYQIDFKCCGSCHNDDSDSLEHWVSDKAYFTICCGAKEALKESRKIDTNNAIDFW